MAAHVTFHAGRFDPDTEVVLVRASTPWQMRVEHGEEVDRQRAGIDGSVSFSAGVQLDAGYFAIGRSGEHPIEVRARGRAVDPTEVAQPPVKPTRSRQILPARGKPTAQTNSQRQEDVAPGTIQASDTATGSATPI